MSANILGGEKTAVLAFFNATVNTGSPGATGVADIRLHENVLIESQIGAVGAAQDVVYSVVQGQGAAMANEKALGSVTIAADASNTQHLISFRQEKMDVNNDYNHVRLDITHGDAAGGPIAATILGMDSVYQPSDQLSSASRHNIL